MKTINYENYYLIVISSDMGTKNNKIAMSIKNNFINDSLTKKERNVRLSGLVKMNKATLVEKKLPINGKSLEHIQVQQSFIENILVVLLVPKELVAIKTILKISIYLSICLSVCLSIYLSIYIYMVITEIFNS